MGNAKRYISLCTGLVIALALLAALLGAFSINATASPVTPETPVAGKAGYVGSSTCILCHRDKVDALANTRHPWKLRPKDEATIVGQFPVTDVNGMVWTLDDVDWVIGARPGWKQRYIKIIGGVWRILPIQWNIKTQEWVPYHADDWADGTPERDYKESCAGCHTTGFDVDTGEWTEPGIWCEACHGPGEEHITNPVNVKPYKEPDPQMCGQCHSRGKDKATGKHGWPEGFIPGRGQDIGDFYNYDWSTKRWWYDNPNDPNDPGHAKSHHQQYMEWTRSAHARSLDTLKANEHAQDFCLNCHSADYRLAPEGEKPTLETAKWPVTCQVCHYSHKDAAARAGDIPPDRLLRMPEYQLCTSCHNGTAGGTRPVELGKVVHHPMQEMYEGKGFPGVPDNPSPHFVAMRDGKGGPSCVNCHFVKTAKSAVWDPQTGEGDITSHLGKVVMPGDAKPGEPDSCTTCHTNADKEGLQKLIDERQAEIRRYVDELKAWLQANADQADTDAYKTVFTAVSFVESEGSFGIHNYFYAKDILRKAYEAIGQTMPEAKAGYVGAETCAACHGDTYDTYMTTLHPWKLRPKDEATIVGQFPVTDVNGMTWTLDDVDWVIGARPKWKQRYIKIIDGVWRILPIQWNIKTQEWVPYHADDWADGTPERDYKQLCAGCHTTGFNVETGQWIDPGVTCEACHGPGEQHARTADPTKIYKSVDAEVCGACHSRGKDKATGKHGWPEGYVPGGDVRLSDVYNFNWTAGKWWYDNPTDPNDPGHAKSHHQQYMEWIRSKHAQSLDNLKATGFAREFCLACHSADYRLAPEDEKPTVETAQFGLTCVTCHTVHTNGAEGTHQLRAPEYELCTQCHNGTRGGSRMLQPGSTAHHPMQEMFEGWGALDLNGQPEQPNGMGAPHYLAWKNEGTGPICSDCHYLKTAKSAVWDPQTGLGDITSHLGTVVEPEYAKSGEPDSCTVCHDWGKDYLQNVIEGRQRDIRTRVSTIQALLSRFNAFGETTPWKVAYTNLTFAESEGSFGIHNYGYATHVLNTAEQALRSFPSIYVPVVLK